MTPCPQCGRLGLEAVACLSCGYQPAAVDQPSPDQPAVDDALIGGFMFGTDAATDPGTNADGSAHDDATPSLTRLGLLVVLACLLAVAAAVVLLKLPGVERQSSQAGSPAPPQTLSASSPAGSSSATPTPTPTTKTSTSATRSRTARPSTSPVARTSALAPPPRPATTPTTRAAATTPAAPTPTADRRAVSVAKGGPAAVTGCNPRRCHYLVVTTSGFGAGPHRVTCWSARAGQLGGYTTDATTSAQCADGRPADTVWAVVDGVRSPDLVW